VNLRQWTKPATWKSWTTSLNPPWQLIRGNGIPAIFARLKFHQDLGIAFNVKIAFFEEIITVYLLWGAWDRKIKPIL